MLSIFWPLYLVKMSLILISVKTRSLFDKNLPNFVYPKIILHNWNHDNYLPLEIQIRHSNILRQRRGQKGDGPLLYQSWLLGNLFDVLNKLFVIEPTSLHPVIKNGITNKYFYGTFHILRILAGWLSSPWPIRSFEILSKITETYTMS